MSKPMAHCNLRKQMGQRLRGLRSASSKWLEPCIRQASHWQWRSPNMCPISWAKVWKTKTWRRLYHPRHQQQASHARPFPDSREIGSNQLPHRARHQDSVCAKPWSLTPCSVLLLHCRLGWLLLMYLLLFPPGLSLGFGASTVTSLLPAAFPPFSF